MRVFTRVFLMAKLISFTGTDVLPEHDYPRPERLVRGNPRRTTWNHFTNSRGDMNAGIWACEPGAWQIAFAPGKDEFFSVISGRIRITDSEGAAREFGPGDACIIPGGFTGTFEVLEAVRKYYVLLEPRS